MNASLYGELMNHAEINYSNKVISNYIVIIKQTKSATALQNMKYKLFFALSKLTIKAINNFNHLTRNVPRHKLLHTPEDIAIECYVIYDTCLRDTEINYAKKFYFYLNTSLNRAIYRLFEKQYQCYFNVVENTKENEYLLLNAGYNQHFDFSEVDLSALNELELDILRFKIEGGKLNQFLKEHNLQSALYNQMFGSIKQKLYNLYKEEDYFKHLVTMEP
jgi:hypothetical protein